MPGSILPLFPLLSSHDPVTRLDASVSLLSSLPTASSSASASTSSADSDTSYAIKRLVTGLGSSNDAARQGFAVALTELLVRLPPKQADEVLPLILSTSTPTASVDGREERDLLFGRLLGMHAVVKSGILVRKGAESPEPFKEVALALHAIAGKKSWIRESAYWILVDSLRSLLLLERKQAPSWRDEVTQWAVQRFLVDSREKARGWSPEKIALVLALQSCGVSADWESILSPAFPSGNPLARSSLSTLSLALKGSSIDADASANGRAPKMGSNAVKTSKKGGSPLPGAAPHFVWSEIFDLYFPDTDRKSKAAQRSGADGRARWSEVWRILVDQSLFAPPSLPLKATGFSLLSLAMQRLPPSEVPSLFGEGVVRTFTNHLRKSGDGEKTLQRVAEKLAAALPPFLNANPSVALPLLKTLVAPPHGAYTFDARTTERIVAKLDAKGIRGWVKYLEELVLSNPATVEPVATIDEGVDVEDEQKALTASRLWAFDQLLHVAKTGVLEKDDDMIAGLLEFFAVLGWFEVRKSGNGARSYIPTPPLSESLRAAARSRFYSVLTALPIPSTGATWLSRALGLLVNLSTDKKHFTEVIETEPDISASRSNVAKMLAKLTEFATDDRQRTAKMLGEGLLLLSYDEPEETVEGLESLQDTLRVLFPGVIGEAASSADQDDDAEMADGEAPEPATVLVDLLLELLHRPSAFVKRIVQTVFSSLAGELGEQGLELILEQIRPEEIVASESEAEMQPQSGLGKSAAVKAQDESDESDSSDSNADDDGNDESDDGGDVDEAFRNELLAALQASGVAEQLRSDNDDDGDSAEESEEELLDDEQMMALDDRLADIFRLQGGGRKGRKVDQTNDLHYRLRVMDLLETLVKQRTANHLLVHAVVPLFNISRRVTVLDKELQGKALRLLRQVVDRKEPPISPTPNAALDSLAELHGVARALDNAKAAPLCSSTAIYLVRAALASPPASPATTATIVGLFGDSLEQYLSTKNARTRVQPALTLDFVKRSPAASWPLFKRVVAMVASDTATVNTYRRMQAFEVAQALLLSHVALGSPQAKAELLAEMPPYRNAIHETLTAALNEASTAFDNARLKELAKIALAAARTTVTAAHPDREVALAIWRGNEFAPLLERVRRSERFQSATAVQALFKQLLVVLETSEAADPADKKRQIRGAGKADLKNPRKAKKSSNEAVQVVESVSPQGEVEVEEDEDTEEVSRASIAAPGLLPVASKKREKKRNREKQ